MNVALAIYILAFGVVKIDVANTESGHLYFFGSSTNLAAGWDNGDAMLFFGNGGTETVYVYPPHQQEYFRVIDLGPGF